MKCNSGHSDNQKWPVCNDCLKGKQERIERCGFCGRFFRGKEYLLDEEISKLKRDKDVNFFVLYDYNDKQIELGYCPEANAEAQYEQQSDYV